MISLSFIITIAYCFMIIAFYVGMNKIDDFNDQNNLKIHYFSIIIPFRNERENLHALLSSLDQVKYPKEMFEIIMINDDSTDDYQSIIDSFKRKSNLKIRVFNNIRKNTSPKKDAINLAIKKAEYNWIITTDADCIVPENWLNTLDQFIQKTNPKMIISPVDYVVKQGFITQFQQLDILSLQGTTMGSIGIKKPILCNGANLCYLKDIFNELDGFNGNNHIASGDDIFLMEKFVENDLDSVKYLKSAQAIVLTQPETSFQSLLQQRIRWAAKSSASKNSFSKLVGIIVFLMNFLLIIDLILASFNLIDWNTLGYLFLIKFNIDFLLIYKTSTFFKKEKELKRYFAVSLFYPFFTSYVAFSSLFRKFEWKSRSFSK